MYANSYMLKCYHVLNINNMSYQRYQIAACLYDQKEPLQ